MAFKTEAKDLEIISSAAQNLAKAKFYCENLQIEPIAKFLKNDPAFDLENINQFSGFEAVQKIEHSDLFDEIINEVFSRIKRFIPQVVNIFTNIDKPLDFKMFEE